ncbi:LEA type 2 family protein [Paraglaciecola aestuariivivens]
MKKLITGVFVISVALILSACANLTPHFEKPQVKVSSFRVLPGQSLNPTFEIGLLVTNPNSVDLNIKGMAYTASIAGKELLSGVANQLPIVPAYGQESISLHAQADWLSGIKVLAGVLKNQDAPIRYQLKVKLDVGLFSLPIYINQEGELSLPRQY